MYWCEFSIKASRSQRQPTSAVWNVGVSSSAVWMQPCSGSPLIIIITTIILSLWILLTHTLHRHWCFITLVSEGFLTSTVSLTSLISQLYFDVVSFISLLYFHAQIASFFFFLLYLSSHAGVCVCVCVFCLLACPNFFSSDRNRAWPGGNCWYLTFLYSLCSSSCPSSSPRYILNTKHSLSELCCRSSQATWDTTTVSLSFLSSSLLEEVSQYWGIKEIKHNIGSSGA